MAITQDQKFTNNATTTVPATISNVATSITVATGTGALFPTLAGAEFALCTIVNSISSDPGFGQLEIVRVTARSGDVFTITRAQDGTTAKSFPAGCVFELRPTAGGFNEIYSKMIAGDALQAPLASPVFTGNPTAPTPSPGDNDTSLATTAFVTTAITAASGRLIGIQTFNASGTYTPTAGMVTCVAELVGGGGGGGGCPTTGASQASSGAGGGAGGYGKILLTAAQVGASKAITIGAAGTGVLGNTGNTGGNTIIDTIATAGGGVGGGINGPVAVSQVQGAQGGGISVSVGTVIMGMNGSPGGSSALPNTSGFSIGNGGSSPLGAGGLGSPGATGGAASGAGAGGGGTVLGASQSALAGGSGSVGQVIIWEYA